MENNQNNEILFLLFQCIGKWELHYFGSITYLKSHMIGTFHSNQNKGRAHSGIILAVLLI